MTDRVYNTQMMIDLTIRSVGDRRCTLSPDDLEDVIIFENIGADIKEFDRLVWSKGLRARLDASPVKGAVVYVDGKETLWSWSMAGRVLLTFRESEDVWLSAVAGAAKEDESRAGLQGLSGTLAQVKHLVSNFTKAWQEGRTEVVEDLKGTLCIG